MKAAATPAEIKHVTAILSEYGISVSPAHRYPLAGETRAVSTIARIIDRFGEGHLRLILTTIVETERNKLLMDEVGLWMVSDMIRAFGDYVENNAEEWLQAWDRMPVAQMQWRVRELRGVISQRFALGGITYSWLADQLLEPDGGRLVRGRCEGVTLGRELIMIESQMPAHRFEDWIIYRSGLTTRRARMYMRMAREAEAAEAGEAA